MRDQAQLADIDLHHCSFGDDAQGGVEGRGGVLLHAEDGEAEGGLQLWVRDVSLFETQALRWGTVDKNKVSKIGHLGENIWKKKTTKLCGDLTIGLIKRSYLGGFRVKPSPTKQTLVTIRFQAFFCLFPVLMTLSTSVSPWARTLGRGTSHLP